MILDRSFVGLTSLEVGFQEPVYAYKMTCAVGVSITVWTYGAALVEVNLLNDEGRWTNVVMRLPKLVNYESRSANPSYLGATTGRFARCVSNGTFSIDGKVHNLSRNVGPHHFHGGHHGFSTRVWSAQMDDEGDESILRLTHTSVNGEDGYPGQVEAAVEYRLSPDGELMIVHFAVTDAPTIVALSNHAYWNLSGEGSIDQHRLQVNSAVHVESGPDHIPTGRLAAVAETDLDFRMMRNVGSHSLDNCFVLKDRSWCMRIEDPISGRVLEVDTDHPVLALHTGENLPLRRGGIAIQATDFPDAPNRPEFPSAVLRPNEIYQRVTRYRFGRLPASSHLPER